MCICLGCSVRPSGDTVFPTSRFPQKDKQACFVDGGRRLEAGSRSTPTNYHTFQMWTEILGKFSHKTRICFCTPVSRPNFLVPLWYREPTIDI